MVIYIIIFLLILCSSIFELLKGRKLFGLFIVNVVVLVFFVGFRQCGADFSAYTEYFPIMHNSQISEIFTPKISMEPLFIILNIFSPSFEFLIFIVSVLSIILLAVVLYKYSPYPLFSLLLLFSGIFLLTYMGQIRQGLALSFVMGAFFISQKNIVVSCIFILFAILFHYSALIAFLFFIVPSKIYTYKKYILSFVCIVVLAPMSKYLLAQVIDFLPSFAGNKLYLYIKVEKGSSAISLPLSLYRLCVFSILYFLLLKKQSFFYRRNGTKIRKKMDYKLLNLYFIGICIPFFFYFLPQISGRGFMYFSCLDVFLIPMCIYNLRIKINKILIISVFSIIGLLLMVKFLNNFSSVYIPYTNVLF
ncbi:MAG: EpsG family protein [Bacteroidales bacterium]|nr:EpsG family protein [Bacteroidales bacterium]